MHQKKLLVLGSTPECTLEIVKYAQSIDVHVIVTDYYPKERTEAKSLADEAWMLSVADVDLLEEKCRAEGVTAVMCGADEFCQDKVIELCERLSLPCYCTKEAWQYNRNKAAFKRACRQVGLPVAKDYSLEDAENDRVTFPVVVKPVDKNSNLGISFCHNREELLEGIRLVHTVSDNPGIIIEQMIVGDEIACGYALAGGKIARNCVSGLFSQPGESTNLYSLVTSATMHKEQYLRETDARAKELLRQIGCREGFAFIQYKRNNDDGKLYALEMGYRMTGAREYLAVEKINGFNLIKWMVDFALEGKNPASSLPRDTDALWKACSCSYILWSAQDGVIGEISGFDRIKDDPSVISVLRYHDIGYRVHAGAYEASVVFKAEDCDEMCRIIDRINRLAVMNGTDGRDLLLRFTDFDGLKQQYLSGLAAQEC